MAQFHVPTEGGQVSVRLDSVPKDAAERERMIDEKLARGEYEPLPNPAIRGAKAMGPGGGVMGTLATAAKRAAPAIGGGLLGGAAGGLVGGPPGALLGGSAGAMAGEALTQYGDPFKTGDAPDWRAIPLAGAVPGAAAGSAKMVGQTLAHLPGIAAGRQSALQQAIGPQGSQLMRPHPPSAPLWQQVERQSQGMSVPVPTGRLKDFSGELRTLAEGDAFGGAKLRRLATQLETMSGGTTGVAWTSLPKFRQNMSSLGAEIAAQEKVKGGGAALGKMKQAYKAMWDELDDAVSVAEKSGNQVGATLRQAMEAHKKELAEKEIGKIYNTAMSYSSGQRQVDPNSMLKQLDVKDSMLSRWMPQDELQEIKDILKDYGKVPKIPSQNEPVGNLSRVASAMGPDQFASIMSSRPGRRLIRALVEHEVGIEHGLLSPAIQYGGRLSIDAAFNPPAPVQPQGK